MMLQKKQLLLLGMAAFLCGCSESYPVIEDQLIPEQREVYASSEHESELVPIRPTLDAPDFHITTRGSGPFDAWEVSSEHWKQIQFHVFAYQTNNKYGGAVNMNSVKIDGQTANGIISENGCLLYDRIMMIQDSKTMKFVNPSDINEEKVFFYSPTHQNYKYNFFTYFMDDAADNKPLNHSSEPNKITLDFEIDGTQDLMHSFAYHTEDYYKEIVSQRIKEYDKNLIKILTDKDSYSNLLYSTATGHRSIDPYFKINHLLSKFNIRVRGAKSQQTAANDYKNIIITKISVESPNKGTLTVANDAWGKLLSDAEINALSDEEKKLEQELRLGYAYERDYAAGKLINWKKKKDSDGNYRFDTEWLTTPIKSNKVNSTSFDATILNEIDESSYYHVDSQEEKELSEQALLLAPTDEYRLTIDGWFINHINADDENYEGAWLEKWPIAQDIPVKLNDGKPFEPGKEYTLTIYVYGRQKVGLEISFGESWVPGGNIDINKDGEGEGL